MTTYAILTTIIKLDDARDLSELTPKMVAAVGRYKGVDVLAAKLGALRNVKGKPSEAHLAGTASEIAKLAVHGMVQAGRTKKRPTDK